MTERVIDRMMEMAGQLREQAAEAETIGRLTDQTTKAMKAAGNTGCCSPPSTTATRSTHASSPKP